MQTKSNKKAVILLSGGLDSTTVLALAIEQGFEPCCLTFKYGQRHQFELNAARTIAGHYGVKNHVISTIDLRAFGGSALTSDTIEVPKTMSAEEEIPVTYVPARNTIFLSFALAWAEVLGAWDIFIGVNALDYSGYPDCRPEFIDAFQRVADLGTRAGVNGDQRCKIHTPLINMTKADIIKTGTDLGVDYGLTHSCYDPDPEGRPCGQCDACRLRRKGFKDAGLTDPLSYTKPSN